MHNEQIIDVSIFEDILPKCLQIIPMKFQLLPSAISAPQDPIYRLEHFSQESLQHMDHKTHLSWPSPAWNRPKKGRKRPK